MHYCATETRYLDHDIRVEYDGFWPSDASKLRDNMRQYPGGKIGVLPILTTGAVPFRLLPESNASAADQHCAKR